MKKNHAILIFSVGAFCFGLNPLFIKLGYAHGWSLGEINVVQATIALVILWIIGAISMKRHPQAVKKLSLKTVISLMIVGSFTGLTSVLYYASMQYLPASLAVMLLFQFVWVGVLFEWLIYRRKPQGKTVITVILTLVGVVFAADVFNGGLSEITWVGFLLGIGSAFTYSAFIIVSGKVATDIPATVRTPIMVTGAALLIFIIFPPHLTLHAEIFTSGSIWIYAGGLALCGLILTPLLFAMSTPFLSPSLATILGAIELPVSVIVAFVGLGEYVGPSRWFGVVLILAAVIVSEMRGIWQGRVKKEEHEERYVG